MRDDRSSSPVEIADVSVSPLQWSISLDSPCPVNTTMTSQPLLETMIFRDAVSSQLFSRSELWSSLDVDDLARSYDSEMTAIPDCCFRPLQTNNDVIAVIRLLDNV